MANNIRNLGGGDVARQNCRDCKGSGFIFITSTSTIGGKKRAIARRAVCPCTLLEQFDTSRMKVPRSESKR